MKISTKGRYALRLMLDLAVYNTGEPISLKDVAKRQNISEKYMEQILSVLQKAGFVVGMILRLTEGELAPVACVGQNPIDCDRRSSCVTVRIWEKLYDAISEVVDNITLQDLVDWHNEQSDQYMI